MEVEELLAVEIREARSQKKLILDQVKNFTGISVAMFHGLS